MILRALVLAFSLLLAVPGFAQTGDADWLYRGSDIARDPAWRFGTLPNGLRYAVRRNALPARQVSIRIRIDAGALNEEAGRARLGPFRRAYAVPRHPELSRPPGAADLAAIGRQLRQRHQRHHRFHRDGLSARSAPCRSGEPRHEPYASSPK